MGREPYGAQGPRKEEHLRAPGPHPWQGNPWEPKGPWEGHPREPHRSHRTPGSPRDPMGGEALGAEVTSWAWERNPSQPKGQEEGNLGSPRAKGGGETKQYFNIPKILHVMSSI